MRRPSYYHYTDGIGVIRIKNNRRPGPNTIPRSGSWVVRELNNGKWIMPCFPEIRPTTLFKMEFLGRITVKE